MWCLRVLFFPDRRSDTIDLDKWVLNTEAHPLRITRKTSSLLQEVEYEEEVEGPHGGRAAGAGDGDGGGAGRGEAGGKEREGRDWESGEAERKAPGGRGAGSIDSGTPAAVRSASEIERRATAAGGEGGGTGGRERGKRRSLLSFAEEEEEQGGDGQEEG